jgi:hypothetical protein
MTEYWIIVGTVVVLCAAFFGIGYVVGKRSK